MDGGGRNWLSMRAKGREGVIEYNTAEPHMKLLASVICVLSAHAVLPPPRLPRKHRTNKQEVKTQRNRYSLRHSSSFYLSPNLLLGSFISLSTLPRASCPATSAMLLFPMNQQISPPPRRRRPVFPRTRPGLGCTIGGPIWPSAARRAPSPWR